MNGREVLISGAEIGGPALAFWLKAALVASLPDCRARHLPMCRRAVRCFRIDRQRESRDRGLRLSAKAARARTLDLVFTIFPVLAERQQLAGTMSGGEQQMLAVGRGLMLQPRLLILDEPSLGLAPVMTDATFQKIQEIHAMGTAILLVEQNVSRALSLVQRAYVLESGKVIMQGTSAELANNRQVQAAYLGI